MKTTAFEYVKSIDTCSNLTIFSDRCGRLFTAASADWRAVIPLVHNYPGESVVQGKKQIDYHNLIQQTSKVDKCCPKAKERARTQFPNFDYQLQLLSKEKMPSSLHLDERSFPHATLQIRPSFSLVRS